MSITGLSRRLKIFGIGSSLDKTPSCCWRVLVSILSSYMFWELDGGVQAKLTSQIKDIIGDVQDEAIKTKLNVVIQCEETSMTARIKEMVDAIAKGVIGPPMMMLANADKENPNPMSRLNWKYMKTIFCLKNCVIYFCFCWQCTFFLFFLKVLFIPFRLA